MSNPNRKQIYISINVWNKLDSLSKYLKKTKVKTLSESLNCLNDQINAKNPLFSQTKLLLKEINDYFLQLSNDVKELKNDIKTLIELNN